MTTAGNKSGTGRGRLGINQRPARLSSRLAGIFAPSIEYQKPLRLCSIPFSNESEAGLSNVMSELKVSCKNAVKYNHEMYPNEFEDSDTPSI